MGKRPRSNKSSFGKRTDAEKEFRSNRRNRGREEGSNAEKPRSFSARSRFEKPAGDRRDFRRGDDERPRRFTRNDDSERPRRFTRSDDSERPKRFSKEGDTDRPKRFGSGFARKEESERKPPFKRESFGDDRERPKRFSRDGDTERPKRFGTGLNRREDGERKSFRRESFGDDREKPNRFSRSDDKRSDKPFERKRFGDDREQPRKFSRADVVKRSGDEPNESKPRRSFVDAKKMDRKKPVGEYVETPKNPEGLIRLNKFIANSGVGSRREADELIKMGLISVNGVTITEMGHKVKPTDDVRHDGKKLTAEKPVYILLNKPKGFITTTDDPEERRTVMSLVASATKARIYPVGRLDRNTTGLLLFTNDGDLADKLTHPSYNAKKVYKVELDRPLSKGDFEKIQQGIHLEEGKAMVDDVAIVSDDKKTVGIEIHIGWNRIVRRIFESLGYDVVKLDRVVYAGLDKKDLPRGEWRFLKPEEVINLKHLSK
jgi:23S rRNA pseudouridine2605 synthase